MPLLSGSASLSSGVVKWALLGSASLSALGLLAGCGASSIGSLATPASTPTTAPAAVKTGPQLGYIWSDKDRTLTPVLGVPGSSQLGQSVVPANLYVAGAAAANTSVALLQESDGTIDVMSLPTGSPTRLAARLGTDAQIRFAPSGLVAIAFVPGTTGVTVFTNLTTTPQTRAITFVGALSEAVVSDSGGVAGALQQLNGMTIQTISASGAGSAAGSVGSLGGMAFAGTSDDLLLADAAANSLTLVKSSTSSPAPSALATAALLHTPLGVQASHDGHWAVLANAGDANVVRVDLTGRTQAQGFACACQPAQVSALSGAGVFRLTGADAGPAWIFDAAPATPRVLFIPANPLTADASSTQKSGTN